MTFVRNYCEDVMLASVLISHIDLTIPDRVSYLHLPGIINEKFLDNNKIIVR